MSWNYGTLSQKFKIQIDIEPLLEDITDKIIERIADDREIDFAECDEYYTEDNNLVIDGMYESSFKDYYSPATRWEPAEYEEERPYISDTDPKWMLDNVPDEFKRFIKIKKVTEDPEQAEHKYNGEEW